MSSSGYSPSSGRNYQENRQIPSIDFSKPPPGYSPQGKHLSANQHYPSVVPKTTQTSKTTTVNTGVPPPLSNKPQINPYHYRGTAQESPQSLSQTSLAENPPPPPPPDSADPRLFPPPPPPSEPYPTMAINPAAVAAPTYIMSSTVYAAFGMPPPSTLSQPSLNQAAINQATMNHAINPVAMNGLLPVGMGAGHQFMNMSQQPNFRLPPQQYQGEYGAGGYSRRGSYNNYVNRKRSANSTALSESDADTPTKRCNSKKKKKPLSQNMPQRKDWTIEEARRALETEKDFNKRHRNPSLIIKFPDLELNRDIVSKFHPKIDNVHFQQPSTPRFCFVTLKDAACVDQVIKDLCKIKFGDGYLVAETKNNKDDEMVKGPEDIDPLTLYVGNLAQEVTVDDVAKAYPKHKRIDIGFAKKMKYTRYAFVAFRTVADAIEGFQATHSTEMYNKSLIVRFRRLHGTVGLPGDTKVQNPPRAEGHVRGEKNESPVLNNVKAEIGMHTHYGHGVYDDENESNEEEEDGPHDLKSILFDSQEERVKVMNRTSRKGSLSTGSETGFDTNSSFNSVHVKDEPPDYDYDSEYAGYHYSRDEYMKKLIKVEPDFKPKVKSEPPYDEKFNFPNKEPLAATSANRQNREPTSPVQGQSKNGTEKMSGDQVEVKREPIVDRSYDHRSEDEDEDEDPMQEHDDPFKSSRKSNHGLF